MKHFWKRLIACALTGMMLLGVMPPAAYGAVSELVTRSGLENAALLEALREVYGDEAEGYLAVLEQYGLLDEDGNLVTDEKIVMDGEEYTLEEIKALLNAPSTELSTVVEVDGQHLTMEDLKTIVEIEEYLAYVKATYFTEQELTDEQTGSFYDLMDAWANGEVMMLSSNGLTGVGPAGVDHGVTLSVEAESTATVGGTYTVEVTASTSSAAPNQDISFSWRAVSGSVNATGGGDVTMHPGESRTLTVSVSKAADSYVDGGATFLVQIYNVKNALLSNGSTRWEKTVTVTNSEERKYAEELSFSLASDKVEEYYKNFDGVSYGDSSITTTGVKMREEKASIQHHLVDGNYMIKNLTILNAGFRRDGPLWNQRLRDENYFTSHNGHVIAKSGLFSPSVRFNINGVEDPSGNNTAAFNGLFFDPYGTDASVPTTTLSNTSWDGDGSTEPVVIENGGSVEIGVGFTKGDYTYEPDGPAEVMTGKVEALYSYRPAMTSCDATISLQETTTTATLESLSAPAGTYYAGQTVPILAHLSYPVKVTADMTITVNGKTLTPENVGAVTNTVTYLYTVDDTSGASVSVTSTAFLGEGITVKGANERDVTVTEANTLNMGELSGPHLESIDREKAFGTPRLAVTKDENNRPQLTVTVPLVTNTKYTAWVLSEISGTTLNALQVMTDQTETDKYAFEVNNTQTPTELTATIPLPYNTSTNAIELTVDFFLDGAVWMGGGLTTQVEGSVPVAAENMTPELTVTPADGTPQTYGPGDEVPLLYAQQNNALELSFALAEGKAYTWGNTSKVSYYKEDGSLADGNAHFAWKSSDPSVASLSVQEGKTVLTPTGKAGEVEITLTALNGDMDDAVSAAITVTFDVGTDPFLIIPESGKTVSIREGQDALVNWTSNICAKNETSGEDGAFVPTTFMVSLYSGTEDRTTPVWTTKLTTDTNNKTISSVTIPWAEALELIYNDDKRSATVTVSAVYNDATYGSYQDDTQQWNDSATATISMISQPASVTLDEPGGGLYQTDRGGDKSVTLTWKVPHLDTTDSGGGKFELYIAGGSLKTPIVETGLGDVTNDGDTYSYTLNVPKVVTDPNDPTSYRDSYSITVKAKNSAESTWAYDSYVLYVYSDSALRLLLDGADAGDSITMSNREKIAGLWGGGGESGSQAIVALQRDIALKNVISINYGEYAWAELADQIAWHSSDSDVATVNYQQGTLYENIENFSYTSYRPSTDFILSGLKDGETTVTASHVRTNISDTLTVDVETLRDKLYLFQCYPKAVTTLTYEVYDNADRTATRPETLKTNEDGEAAIYAPYGIAGDVYCMSKVAESNETVTYLGTIYNRGLVSSEADSTKLQLYPVNTLRLRRAAQAEIYLKTPDGKPYVGNVTFRGGVYRQGEYCLLDKVQFGLQDTAQTFWKTGDQAQTVATGADGRLLVTMDLMQFKTSAEQKEVQAGEKLYYLFQLEYGDGSSADFYPLFLRVDASLNLDDIAASGDSIVAWEKNESGVKRPFIAQQTLKYSPSANANVADIRKSTGNVGPSDTFPQAWVTTSVMWWGDEHAADEDRVNSVMLQDTTGMTPVCQTFESITYPFTSLAFTENVMSMDDAAMKAWGVSSGQNRVMRAVLSEDGKTASRTISLPFKITNMLGVKQAEDDSVLTEALDDIQSNLDVDVSDDVKKMGVGDKMLQGGMKLLAGDAKYDPEKNPDGFGVRLYATSDPTVFRALFCIGGGNMSSGGNVTGVYPEYSNTEDMAFVNVDSPDGGMKNSDKGLMPNPMNIYDMAKGRYLDKMREEGRQAAAGKGVRSFNMDLGGYFEADIVYNTQTGAWECRPLGGGFHVGGGLNYTWNFNSMVGPVPITASVTLGGTLEVRLDITSGKYYTVSKGLDGLKGATSESDFNQKLAQSSYTESIANDYLATIRLFMYIRAFAGIGFDFSVVACKIGVFGQLNLDLNFKVLSRSYLKDWDKISAVGPVGSRKKDELSGMEPRFSGSTGIEFLFKFLFISYEKVFCSVGFEFDSQEGDWDTIEEIWAANKTINNRPVTRMAMPNGQVMYAVDLGAQMESRDYVDASEQVWLGGAPSISLFSLDADQDATLANALQTGAYSYANPVLSDDGMVMFYLSDRPADGTDAQAKDLTNTRVAVSAKGSDGQFQEGGRFDRESNGVAVGYGDSGVKVAGSNNSYAAVWVRQMEDYTPGADDGTLTEGQQMLQMNSTEIIAATSNGGNNWTLHRLTNNVTPDLAPVVAASGNRIVAAWREVSSTSAADLTSFDQQDAIRFAIYEGEKWSETQTLYDGTGSNASVKGIEAAMLKDGTAAVVYTLDTDSGNDSSTDWETVLALIPNGPAGQDAEGNSGEDAVRTFRLTTDTNLDENPQITTVDFGNAERFVVAWHTERAITKAPDGETESDIRLAAMDADGVLYENMPESLSMATGGTGDTIGSNFRFAKNAVSIDGLSILWADTVSGEADDQSYNDIGAGASAGYNNTGHDVLKAVKFVKDGSSYTLSGTVEVAAMADNTLIDHFDAYMNNGEVKSVILGTNYSETTQRQVTVSDGTTDTVMTMEVANPVSGMYAATAEFTNRVEESAVMLEYENLYPNSDIDVQFTIRNSGKDPVTKLEIISGGETVYTSGDTSLNLLPNRDITVTARIPTGAAIENVDYTIKAAFSSEEVSLPGTLYLDIPDVGVSKVETIKEADGERTLRYSLYNALSAKLADARDNWWVQVGFYADKGCTTLLKDESNADLIRTITDVDELALIDAGGYSAEVTLPVGSYAQDESGTQQEIPTTGIPIYVKAWVEAPVKAMARTNEYDTVNEYFQNNNTTSLTLDNLALRRGEDVTIQTTMDNSNGGTKASVNVQYNKLTGTSSGNLIVTLLDANGAVLEQRQSYTGDEADNYGRITLGSEERITVPFQFSEKGSSVQVTYSDLVLNADNANLASLRFEGLPGITLDSFTEDPNNSGTYKAEVYADNLTSTTVIAATESALAKARLSDTDEGSNAVSQTVALEPGKDNTITVTVTAYDKTPKTYTLTIHNNGDPVITIPDDPEAGEYSASVIYGPDNSAEIQLTATASGNYSLSYQWYSCDVYGENCQELAEQTNSTLKIPAISDTGVYYYRCKVTRQLLNGGTKDYWSSVASVQITPASGNYVKVEGTVADYDGQPHGLTNAAAAKSGSTLYYSTDGGETWSTTAPAFTAVGVHTVHVYATNPNYTDTQTVTSDVVIQENANTQFKLETSDVAGAFAGYPQAIKEKYSDAAGLETALKTEVAALGVPTDSTQVYDVKLLFRLNDGNAAWTEATAENFPAAGVTVMLPYPKGTGRYTHNFTLLHLITNPLNTGKNAGTIETMDITLEDGGIQFTADCLSPFVLGWTAVEPETPTDPGTGGSSGYAVTVTRPEHGNVTASSTNANSGSTVTLTVTPDSGYVLDTLTVTDSRGNEILPTAQNGGKYTFTMPSMAVTIKATFSPLPGDVTKPCDGGADCPSRTFTDLGGVGTWYHEAVDYALRNDLMGGYGNGLFGPNNNLTRAQLAQILYNREGRPAVSGSSSFTDVAKDAWYSDAITWASANGIVSGYGGGKFGPDDNITREQLATILWRYSKSPAATNKELNFNDADEISGYALDAILWAVEHGILNGFGDGLLGPTGLATRAQVAQVLKNLT